MKIKLRVKGAYKPARMAERLRDAAAGLPGWASTELQAAALPAAQDARTAVLAAKFPALPAAKITVRRDGSGQGLLQARLAAATHTMPLRNGARVYVEGSEVMPTRGNRLAVLTDTDMSKLLRGGGRWRSPTFGRRDNPQDWHQQEQQPWFAASVRARRERFETAVNRAMRRALRTVDREA